MNALKVEICMGTACFVMGASDLAGLADLFPPEWRGKVEVSGSPCVELCKDKQYGKAPYVRVGDSVICGATPATVIAEIKRQLEAK